MDQVVDRIIDQIRKTAEKYPSIVRLVLFGSRARGDETSGSDYDIAVFGADEKTAVAFSDEIDELPTLHKIDLLFLSERYKGTEIYENIRKEGIDLLNKFTQKLENYEKAVTRLRESIEKAGLAEQDDDSIIKDAVIQRFEFTAELAWKSAREYLLLQGETDINSPKPVMRAAFRTQLIHDDDGWMMILDDRNRTSHLYDEEQADEVYQRIVKKHMPLFEELLRVLKEREKA